MHGPLLTTLTCTAVAVHYQICIDRGAAAFASIHQMLSSPVNNLQAGRRQIVAKKIGTEKSCTDIFLSSFLGKASYREALKHTSCILPTFGSFVNKKGNILQPPSLPKKKKEKIERTKESKA